MIRAALGLGLLTFLALAGPLNAAGLDAGQSPAPPDEQTAPLPDGFQLFATHCTMCHQAPKLAQRIRQAPDRAAALGKMQAFLGHHGRTDAEGDALIVEFLAELAGHEPQ